VKHTGKSDNLSNNLSNKSPYPEAMAHHPTGITFDIVGIEAGNHGRSCEEHDVCGSILEENTVVRIRHVQILVDGKEESALAAYWISDGIDRCHAGFLQHHLLKHWKDYDGRIAQIVDMYKDSESPTKRRITRIWAAVKWSLLTWYAMTFLNL
jgi:hypothetical protein